MSKNIKTNRILRESRCLSLTSQIYMIWPKEVADRTVQSGIITGRHPPREGVNEFFFGWYEKGPEGMDLRGSAEEVRYGPQAGRADDIIGLSSVDWRRVGTKGMLCYQPTPSESALEEKMCDDGKTSLLRIVFAKVRNSDVMEVQSRYRRMYLHNRRQDLFLFRYCGQF